jgi:hypothetical protein
MKLLSTRARTELWRLQNAVRATGKERERALRMLTSSRSALSINAQRDICMEFACADQEYRYALMGLLSFCEKHSAAAGGVFEEAHADERRSPDPGIG